MIQVPDNLPWGYGFLKAAGHQATTGHSEVRYHLILLMSIFQFGVLSKFSAQGFDAHRHISAFTRIAFLTGTIMIRTPAFLTSDAALLAFHLLEALPSVRTSATCCRFLVPPTRNKAFAFSNPLSVIVHPLGHFIALTFVTRSSFLWVIGEIT